MFRDYNIVVGYYSTKDIVQNNIIIKIYNKINYISILT